MRHFKTILTGVIVTLLSCLFQSCEEEKQTPLDKYSIEVEDTKFTIGEDGGILDVRFSANSEWEANTLSSLLEFTSARNGSAGTDQVVSISVPAFSEANSSRTIEFSIKCGEISTDQVVRQFFTINQNGPIVEYRDPGIWSITDLKKFGEQIVQATPDYSEWQDANGVINLMCDIDAGDEPLPLMGSQTTDNNNNGAFNGIFNGNDFTIKGKLESNGNPIVALFTRLGNQGVIKNLNVEIEATNDYAGSVQTHISGIVGFCNTGTTASIENCTVKGSITSTTSKTNTRIGAIAAYCRCNVTNCTNYATIDAHSDRVGGIFGAHGGTHTFTNVTNYGDVTCIATIATQVGGIGGQVQSIKLSGCKNYGNITVVATGDSYAGGIGGKIQSTPSFDSSNPCENHGSISIKSNTGLTLSAKAGVGGIGGWINAAIEIFANNEGSVTSSDDNANPNAGGIIGYCDKAIKPTNCTNKGAIVSACNAGGIIGKTTVATALTKCTNLGTICRCEGATVPTAYFGGMIGQDNKSTLSECTYGGKVLDKDGNIENAVGVSAN